MHISAKILGEKLFRTWEFPRSGSKAKDGEKKKKRRERLNDGDNNGQATHGARKPPGPKTPRMKKIEKQGSENSQAHQQERQAEQRRKVS